MLPNMLPQEGTGLSDPVAAMLMTRTPSSGVATAPAPIADTTKQGDGLDAFFGNDGASYSKEQQAYEKQLLAYIQDSTLDNVGALDLWKSRWPDKPAPQSFYKVQTRPSVKNTTQKGDAAGKIAATDRYDKKYREATSGDRSREQWQNDPETRNMPFPGLSPKAQLDFALRNKNLNKPAGGGTRGGSSSGGGSGGGRGGPKQMTEGQVRTRSSAIAKEKQALLKQVQSVLYATDWEGKQVKRTLGPEDNNRLASIKIRLSELAAERKGLASSYPGILPPSGSGGGSSAKNSSASGDGPTVTGALARAKKEGFSSSQTSAMLTKLFGHDFPKARSRAGL